MPDGMPHKMFLSDTEARDWIGVGRVTFNALVAEHASWCRPIYHGTGQRQIKKWHRDDIWCLAHIWLRQGMAKAGEK